MEALFDLQFTGPEIEALMGAADLGLGEVAANVLGGESDTEALASAKAKLEQAFTTVESAGGC